MTSNQNSSWGAAVCSGDSDKKTGITDTSCLQINSNCYRDFTLCLKPVPFFVDGTTTAWENKASTKQNSSWGAAFCSGDNDKKTGITDHLVCK